MRQVRQSATRVDPRAQVAPMSTEAHAPLREGACTDSNPSQAVRLDRSRKVASMLVALEWSSMVPPSNFNGVAVNPAQRLAHEWARFCRPTGHREPREKPPAELWRAVSRARSVNRDAAGVTLVLPRSPDVNAEAAVRRPPPRRPLRNAPILPGSRVGPTRYPARMDRSRARTDPAAFSG